MREEHSGFGGLFASFVALTDEMYRVPEKALNPIILEKFPTSDSQQTCFTESLQKLGTALRSYEQGNYQQSLMQAYEYWRFTRGTL